MVQKKAKPRRDDTLRKPYRHKTEPYRIGNKVYKLPVTTLQEIKKLQHSSKFCLPKFPFSRIIREILMENTEVNMKVEKKALEALQEAAEIYITQLFEDCCLCSQHAKRITVRPADMKLCLLLRGVNDPGYLLKY